MKRVKKEYKNMVQKRFYCSELGEYYKDCLRVEAAMKNNTVANEAASLLRAKLMERNDKRRQMVEYMAAKRNVSFDEMWRLLLTDNFELTDDDRQMISDDSPS